MKKNDKSMLVGIMLAILGAMLYRLLGEVYIFLYIVVGVVSITIIYDLYKKNKSKIYRIEKNIALVSIVLLAILIGIAKASDDNLINMNMSLNTFTLVFLILISMIIIAGIMYAYNTKSKKEVMRVTIIAGLTLIPGIVLILIGIS